MARPSRCHLRRLDTIRLYFAIFFCGDSVFLFFCRCEYLPIPFFCHAMPLILLRLSHSRISRYRRRGGLIANIGSRSAPRRRRTGSCWSGPRSAPRRPGCSPRLLPVSWAARSLSILPAAAPDASSSTSPACARASRRSRRPWPWGWSGSSPGSPTPRRGRPWLSCRRCRRPACPAVWDCCRRRRRCPCAWMP